MTLKHRLKILEEKIKSPDKEPKMWLIRTSLGVKGIEELEDKDKSQAIIKAITDGQVQHKNGTYYQEGDLIILLSRIFTPTLPSNLDGRLDEIHISTSEKKKQISQDESNDKKIERLKKEKSDLKRKIRGNSNGLV